MITLIHKKAAITPSKLEEDSTYTAATKFILIDF